MIDEDQMEYRRGAASRVYKEDKWRESTIQEQYNWFYYLVVAVLHTQALLYPQDINVILMMIIVYCKIIKVTFAH